MGATAYEALLLAALVLAVGFLLLPLVTPVPAPGGALPDPSAGSSRYYLMSRGARALSAATVFAVCGAYCVGLWSAGRRTLAMKTWRLVLQTPSGRPVGLSAAAARYLACWAGPALSLGAYLALRPTGHGRWALALLAFNYAWALFDPEHQFFQDRVAGTRLRLDLPRAR